jgi:hypothetical protein
MSDLIPFDGGSLPAYLKKAAANVNADVLSHASGGFPVISIKGKQFAVVRDGNRKVLTKTIDGEDIPARSIEVVIVKANKAKSKVFYANGYDPAAESKKPDCFSNDGVRPDSGSENPQSKVCGTCQHNVWGAKGKGKACQDSVRVAVAPASQVNDTMLLRVPPASIRALGEFGSACAKRNVPYNAVITKVSFDNDAESPKLTFKPVGFLDEETYKLVQEAADSDMVGNILGTVSAHESAADAPTEAEQVIAKVSAIGQKDKSWSEDEVKALVDKAEAESPSTKKAAPKKSAPAAADIDVGDLDLNDLSFDD